MNDEPGADGAFPELPPGAFAKLDAGDDADFYAQARLVTHIDATAIATLRDFYRQVLPPGGVLLDLMSSWVSHLPDDVAYAEVIGHGMNAAELAANPRLTSRFVRDFNLDPTLPLVDASVDAVMICVSIQYLQRPAAVLAEARRVLKSGAPIVVSFSNRCFPTKAVAVWRALDGGGHARLVDIYLRRAGFAETKIHRLIEGWSTDPLTAVIGRTLEPDDLS
jgi:hypothetical protein